LALQWVSELDCQLETLLDCWWESELGLMWVTVWVLMSGMRLAIELDSVSELE